MASYVVFSAGIFDVGAGGASRDEAHALYHSSDEQGRLGPEAP